MTIFIVPFSPRPVPDLVKGMQYGFITTASFNDITVHSYGAVAGDRRSEAGFFRNGTLSIYTDYIYYQTAL
jgi:hypothetical protein